MPLARRNAAALGALELAYIGDCVFELIVRTRLLRESGKRVGELHGQVVASVCAAGQAALARRIYDFLTEEEKAVFQRGRNHRGFRKGAVPASTRWRRRWRRCSDIFISAAKCRGFTN